MIVWLLASLSVMVLRPSHVRGVWRRRDRRESAVDDVLVAQLLAVVVASGAPLGVALGSVADHIDGAERVAIDDVLLRARSRGLSRALLETSGDLANLTHRLVRIQASGAPVGPALDTFIDSALDARRARAVESARILGVRLIVPLTLLLLPGFIALVVAPYVVEYLVDFGVRP